jgi:hypothetical protein
VRRFHSRVTCFLPDLQGSLLGGNTPTHHYRYCLPNQHPWQLAWIEVLAKIVSSKDGGEVEVVVEGLEVVVAVVVGAAHVSG